MYLKEVIRVFVLMLGSGLGVDRLRMVSDYACSVKEVHGSIVLEEPCFLQSNTVLCVGVR